MDLLPLSWLCMNWFVAMVLVICIYESVYYHLFVSFMYLYIWSSLSPLFCSNIAVYTWVFLLPVFWCISICLLFYCLMDAHIYQQIPIIHVFDIHGWTNFFMLTPAIYVDIYIDNLFLLQLTLFHVYMYAKIFWCHAWCCFTHIHILKCMYIVIYHCFGSSCQWFHLCYG